MDFISFARAHGVLIDEGKFTTGRIRRCPTVEKPRSDNGAYFWDGDRGWVMDWAGDARPIWFAGTPPTDQDKKQWAQKKAAAVASQEQQWQQAAKRSEMHLKSATLQSHPYLEIKGFPQEKGLVLEDRLLIPMRNVTSNQLQGYQAIKWDSENRKYQKKMMTGMRAKGAVFSMGYADQTWLVEGYATGLSVRAALRASGLGARVLVTFSAHNLVEVASRVKGQRYVFADNDESKTGEEAAKETGLPYVMADEVGWDANDLHLNLGLFGVTAKIMECMWKKN